VPEDGHTPEKSARTGYVQFLPRRDFAFGGFIFDADLLQAGQKKFQTEICFCLQSFCLSPFLVAHFLLRMFVCFVALLEIRNLCLDFVSEGRALRALDGVSLSLEAGETLCLVGESGCGKSVTALSIARLVPTPPARYAAGEILLGGRDTLKMSPTELRAVRGGAVSYVFQEPGVSLNPVQRVGGQIKESLKLHRPEQATDGEVMRLMKSVGLPEPESRRKNYPFELSGGMQQRVMLAMALAPRPKLLVADEPTTALDVTIQAQILDLLCRLRDELGMAILFITHNLGIVSEMAGRVAVMYAGHLVEVAPASDLLSRPLHPYTRALLNSVPKLNGDQARLSGIPGTVPRLGDFPPGCRFAPRCTIARPECSSAVPELVEVEKGRWVRCPFWQETPTGAAVKG
jgi:oligopeptide/dipeptide ABC transporter ATP-binding protein